MSSQPDPPPGALAPDPRPPLLTVNSFVDSQLTRVDPHRLEYRLDTPEAGLAMPTTMMATEAHHPEASPDHLHDPQLRRNFAPKLGLSTRGESRPSA